MHHHINLIFQGAEYEPREFKFQIVANKCKVEVKNIYIN